MDAIMGPGASQSMGALATRAVNNSMGAQVLMQTLERVDADQLQKEALNAAGIGNKLDMVG